MPRSTALRVHLVASLAAVAIVSSFLIASAAVEAIGDESAVRARRAGASARSSS